MRRRTQPLRPQRLHHQRHARPSRRLRDHPPAQSLTTHRPNHAATGRPQGGPPRRRAEPPPGGRRRAALEAPHPLQRLEEHPLKIGFIGAGDLAQAIGGQLAAAGHDVTLSNSRGPHTLTTVAADLGVTADTVAQAAAHTVVFLAVNWTANPAALAAAGDLTGRVLIDTTNPIEVPHFPKYDLGGRTSSEIVGDLAPSLHPYATICDSPRQPLAMLLFCNGPTLEPCSVERSDQWHYQATSARTKSAAS
ncbi:NADPH-dependent F420 reductase [Mycolicibacterium brisbanense]|uniref:NADP oxidoreductase, coenzyme f420-dependent n=1 Tax=Mycolicibacterium brisbanense TaxID=146020 RepID=A0A100VVB5_9MYCO|nr:NAD(P)-binding domain-containing protein [Mycolicibacterium brisbanense]GAS86561.1 NADP oxidoreductase, coenzyme f420-dependent [Mycolicibacterium brisbanense]